MLSYNIISYYNISYYIILYYIISYYSISYYMSYIVYYMLYIIYYMLYIYYTFYVLYIIYYILYYILYYMFLYYIVILYHGYGDCYVCNNRISYDRSKESRMMAWHRSSCQKPPWLYGWYPLTRWIVSPMLNGDPVSTTFFDPCYQWIGLRENLQETIFPLNMGPSCKFSLKPMVRTLCIRSPTFDPVLMNAQPQVRCQVWRLR